MKTIILCGGYGTRIRDVAEDIPKPMIPIGSYPILWHIMKYYAHFNYKNFVLCLGYKSHAIKDFFLNYEARTNDFTVKLGSNSPVVYHNNHSEVNWEVTFAETGLSAMTGARVKKVEKYIGSDDDFMLTYGDGVGDVDLDKLVKFHKSHGKVLTVTGVRPPGRFGELMKDKDGKVLEFNEKPQTSSGLISGGFFICKRSFFDYIKTGDNVVLEQEPLRELVKQGQMMVYQHDGFWQPMDTYRDYTLLNSIYDKGEAPWVLWK